MRRASGLLVIVALLTAVALSASAQQQSIRVAWHISDAQWPFEAARLFEERTGIKVEIEAYPWGPNGKEKLLVELAAGLEYDAVNMNLEQLAELAGDGLVLRLDPFFERDNFDLEDFLPNSLAGMTNAQGIWALPGGPDSYVPIINLNMWDAAGLPYPEPDWTWAEFREQMKRLTILDPEGQNNVYGTNGIHWRIAAHGFGADIITPDGRFDLNQPHVIDALQMLYDLRLVDQVMVPDSAAVGGVSNHARLGAGKVAVHWVGPWFPVDAQSNLANNPSVRWGVANPPRSDYAQATLMFMGGWFLPATSSNTDLGWEWMKFLYSDEVQLLEHRERSTISPRLSIAMNPDVLFWDVYGEWAQPMLTAVALGRALPFHPQVSQVVSQTGQFLSRAELGETSVVAAMQQLVPVIEALLSQ